ncbi:hypothetical protein [Bacillus thermotolerans]|uniref:Uncharacterized protein n=1 Tax=Bacillus thermotolerans TaxID=1221996 RepID=A0A0F5HXQ9_BACTR|nr:hypothetical protein [Bacillus thermotolerans]KKB33611.1 hypothetical protein QY96_00496 [Bacillus thermotolerans]KKB34425.1 hypothetical protein QY97_02498 [Bacillus thermotolerans]KKB38169.1 hypothetical protein QY95_02624 [Bacillus thermotolerans]
MKKEKRRDEPVWAEGIDTEDELMTDATPQEIAQGEYTEVVTVSLDENDPS